MSELSELGLTKNEEKIYVTLLELGSSLAGTIAEKAGVHRRNTYDALKRLVEKGLISYVSKGKRKFYEPLHPERLVEIQKEKLMITKDILPELLTKFQLSRTEQEVITLEGTEGMKTFFLDYAEGEDERLLLGATGIAYEKLKYFFPHILKRLKKLKKPVKILWTPTATNRKKISAGIKSINKTLPKEFSSPTQVFIYKDKTAIAIWSEKPIIVIIVSKEVQAGFKKYFQFLWKVCR